MPPALANTLLQPLTRSITAETCGPFSMITSPLPPSLSTMYWHEISPACTLFVVTVASAPSAAVSTATTITPAACAFLIAGPIAFGSPGLSRIISTPAAMKLSIWVTCLPRSYSKPTVVILTLGLAFLASNSAPFESATKNGLPSEPSDTPIDFSSLADDGAELMTSANAAPASDIVFNIGFLPGPSCSSTHGGPVAVEEFVATRRRGRRAERSSSAGRALQPVTVECDGADDNETLDDVLPDVGHAHQYEPI